MKKTLLVAALGAAALAGTAHAQRFASLSGGKLAELCTSRDRTAIQACEGYINGISDTVSFYQRLRPSSGESKLPAYICVPGNVTGVQLRQTVVQYAEQHRDALNQQASGIVLKALDAAYLCPGEQNHVQ